MLRVEVRYVMHSEPFPNFLVRIFFGSLKTRMLELAIFASIFLFSLIHPAVADPFTLSCTGGGGSCACNAVPTCGGYTQCPNYNCVSSSCPSTPANTYVSSNNCLGGVHNTCLCLFTPPPPYYCSGSCSCYSGGTCTFSCNAGWYDEDGSSSNGCENQAPYSYAPSENTTTPFSGASVIFNVNWTDTTGLTNNGLGVNYTWIEFNISLTDCTAGWNNYSYTAQNNVQSVWFNTTQTIPSQCVNGTVIAWRQYANDSANRVNVSDTRIVTAIRDFNPPTYSLNSSNSTWNGTIVMHSMKWADDYGLSGYIFSFDNGTGTLVNDTWTAFSGSWSNVTKTVNSTVGSTIRWCVYANDTSINTVGGNWNGTSCMSPYNYIITQKPPLIRILSPLNQSYSSLWIWANVSLDVAGSWCGVSLDNGLNNSLTNSSGNWNYNLSIGYGSHKITFYCNNTYNFWNSSALYFSTSFSVNITTGMTFDINSTQHNVTFIIGINSSSISAGQAVRINYGITNLDPSCTKNFNTGGCDPITSNLINPSQIRIWFGDNLTYQTISKSLYGTQSTTDYFDMTVPSIDSSCYDIKAELVYTDANDNNAIRVISSNEIPRGTCFARNTTNQPCYSYLHCQDGLYCLDSDNFGVLDTCEATSTSYGYLCEQYGEGTKERVSALDGSCRFAYSGSQNRNLPDGSGCTYRQDCINDYCWDSNGDGNTYCNSATTDGNSTGIIASSLQDCSSSACFYNWQCYSTGSNVTINGVNYTCTNGNLGKPSIIGDIEAQYRNVTYTLTSVTKNSTHIIANSTFSNNETSTFTLLSSYFYFGDGANMTRSINVALTQGQSEIEQYVITKPSSIPQRYYLFYTEALINNSIASWWTTSDSRCYDSLSDIFLTTGCFPPPQWSNNVSATPTQGCSNSQLSIIWTDNTGVSTVLIEGNWSGYPVNYSATQYGSLYTYSVILPVGTFYWKSYAQNSGGVWNVTDPWIITTTVGGYIYSVKGNAYDASSGSPVSSATGTAIIKQSGEKNIGTVTNGAYLITLSTCLNSNQTKFDIGLIFSTGVKKGFSQITIGNGPFATQAQQCSTNQLHFSGTAIDVSSGNVINSGTINVNAKGTISYSNTTTFSNGSWDIYISPCLVSGASYQFNFIITSSDGRQSNLILNQIAP
jgi:hypothetical protein